MINSTKCIFCKKNMKSKLEMELRTCHNCVIITLMKRHGMTVKKPKAPIFINTKKFDKE
jgi:hypothetical protein